jgi:CheY-like chemotaxis protein
MSEIVQPVEPVFLYIEDDRLSRTVVDVLLKRTMGFKHVYVMSDSEWALQNPELLVPTPTIVFLDIHMKVIDGYEVFKSLRGLASYRDAKIVALTASFMRDEVKRLKEVGFDSGIAKPINADTFPNLVKRLLDNEEIWHIS